MNFFHIDIATSIIVIVHLFFIDKNNIFPFKKEGIHKILLRTLIMKGLQGIV